jgi:stress response protein SCP2
MKTAVRQNPAMSILDRTRTSSSHQAARPFPVQARGLTGTQLLEAADASHSIAEQEFDRSLETREALEHAYLAAAQALDGEQHPRRAYAWLGLATVRRYQKGRRDDALAAYDEALTAAPEDIKVWDAYLDYITYAVSAAALLAIVERMPAPIRSQKLPHVIAVGQGADRWGTMSLDDQRRFTEDLPALLEALDDRPSLGALLSTTALHEYRNGSHAEALQLMRRAAATGFPSPACVDRLTIELVKLGEKAEAAMILRDALTRPVPSDSMRSRMTKRLARCTTAARAPSTDADDHGDETTQPTGTRQMRPGENTAVTPGSWRAQIGWHDPSNTVDVDVIALLLRSNRQVGSDSDMVFYNQLVSPDGSVRHGGEQTLGSANLFEELQVDLLAVPVDVTAIAVCASVHTGTFADVVGLHVRLEGDTNLVFAVPPLSTQRAIVLFEFYRRAGTWKVRAIGQGYDDGLAGLARDLGVSVA